MKKNILFIAWVALFSLFASNSQAQSLKDLLNKDNISKVVNAITGTPETIDMTGTWTYSGSAVEFESDNLLMKAGGAAAATMASGHQRRTNELHVQRRQYFHQHRRKKETERHLFVQCFHQAGRLKVLETAESACESELHFQLYGFIVQLRQAA